MSKLKQIYQNAAGIDIGAEKIFVCAEDEGYEVFSTFTQDIKKAAAYLKGKLVESVAMEATGVYWLAVKEILENEGLKVVVVNAADARNLPGRDKTDVKDCQWIRTLHMHGILRPCFIPDEKIAELRSYMRVRADHIEMAASHIRHLQKAFIQMNIHLHNVLSQLTGVSSKRIIEAILTGERDPQKLVLLCDKQILKNKREEVIKSLEGNYKKEHLFALGQAYESWGFYQKKIEECDKEIEEWLNEMTKQRPEAEHISKAKPIRHHKPQVAGFHEKMFKLVEGKDIGNLPGLTDYSALKLISEIGTDMSKWPNAKAFTSWLGLAPKKHYSGKTKRLKRGRSNTKAGQILKEAAQTLLKSKYAGLGSFAKRIRATKGPAIAIKATARKIGIQVYNVLTKGITFVEKGTELYEKQVKETELAKLKKWATKLGLTVNEEVPRSVHQ